MKINVNIYILIIIIMVIHIHNRISLIIYMCAINSLYLNACIVYWHYVLRYQMYICRIRSQYNPKDAIKYIHIESTETLKTYYYVFARFVTYLIINYIRFIICYG